MAKQAPAPAEPIARPEAAGGAGVEELKVTAHLMNLDAGLFCVLRQGGAGKGGADPRTGLPGVRVSPPPGQERSDSVAISTFRPDGWLAASNEAALVRVTAPSRILVTIYQSAGAAPDTAPRLQVMRLAGDAAPAPGEAPVPVAGAAAGAPASGDVVAHVQRQGDVGVAFGEWIGAKGSKLWVEGFGVTAPAGMRNEDIEYQAVLGRGWLSPWVTGGKFCGSRGMALPLLGIRARLLGEAERTHTLSYEATFVDGTESGEIEGGESCEAESLAPLESFRISLTHHAAAARPEKPEARADHKPKVAPKPAPPAPGRSVAKRGR